MSAKREGMARSWEVATRELPNFWERTQGKSWAEKVGQNKKLGSRNSQVHNEYQRITLVSQESAKRCLSYIW